MERREFLRASCLAGAASLSALAAGDEPGATNRLPGESEAAYRTRMARARAQAAARARTAAGARDYYELRRYEIENWEQRSALDWFAAEAAIPALNRHKSSRSACSIRGRTASLARSTFSYATSPWFRWSC
jgi:hypothetical protein